MNRGLINKTIREVWFGTLLAAVGMAAVEVLLAYTVHLFAHDLNELTVQWLEWDFAQNLLKGLLGTEIGVQIGPDMITSVPWVHPMALALLWAHAITFCTRVPAGEVDRGSVDVLLGLPVSRTQVFTAELLVWLVAGLIVVLMGLLGNIIGSALGGSERGWVSARTLAVIANLYCLYLAVGALAWLVSSLSDRRGRAVAVVFAIVLASFLLNFLAQFWAPAKTVAFLSLLNYHRPLLVLRDTASPFADMLVLLITATVLWIAATLIFTRRDIRTV